MRPALKPSGLQSLRDWQTAHSLTEAQARAHLTADRIISWNHETYVVPLPDEEAPTK